MTAPLTHRLRASTPSAPTAKTAPRAATRRRFAWALAIWAAPALAIAAPPEPPPERPAAPGEPEPSAERVDGGDPGATGDPERSEPVAVDGLVPPALDDVPPVPYPAAEAGGAQEDPEVEVRLSLEIDESGAVLDARVLAVRPAAFSPRFGPAARRYARTLRFVPATYEGVPIPVEIEFDVRFVPPSPARDAAAESPAPTPPKPSAEEDAEDGDAEPGSKAGDAGLDLDVVGTRPRAPSRAASDFDMDIGRLADVPRSSAQELLRLAPGVFLSNAGGEGHPTGIFLRGFDAAEGQDLEIVVQGVPINEISQPHGHGMADTGFVIPELVTSLRVIEGSFDPRQGDFAVAGTAEYRLGLPMRGVMVKGGYGRFAERRALVAWGPAGESSGTYAALDARGGDGFGPNRSHRSVRFLGGFERDLPAGFRFDATVAAHAAQWLQAGVLREDDVDARGIPSCPSDADGQFFCTYDPNQGGFLSRFAAMTRLSREREQRRMSASLFATRRVARIRENFTGFVEDQRPDGAPPRGDGLEQPYEVTTVGSRGHWATRGRLWGLPQDFEIGYAARYDDGRSTLRRLRRQGGAPYDRVFDHRFRVLNPAAYVEGVLRPWWRLDLRVGVRADVFAYSLQDRNQPAEDRDGAREPYDASEAFGFAVQPRAGATLMLTDWLDLMLAYGIGTRSSDVAALSEGEVAPFARAQSAETGLRGHFERLAGRLDLELRTAGFYTHVDQDLIFDESVGRNVLVGESNRFGVLGAVRTGMPEWFDLQASFTWSEAYLPPPEAGPFAWTAGPRLPYIPRFVSRVDGSLFHGFRIRGEPFRWNFALGMSAITPRPLPLGQFGDGFAVFDAAARLRWRWVELGVEVTNLFDARYRQFELNYASNFASAEARPSLLPVTHFVAGPPLQAMGTLTLYFESGSFRAARDEWSSRRVEP